MHKLRLLLVLGLMFAIGGSLAARAQDGTFNDQDKKSDVKHSKAKKSNDNAGRRKHWYSPPHWFHKKHHNDTSTAKSGKTGKTVAASNSDIKPLPESKPVKTTTGTKSATATGQQKKTVAGAKRRRNTIANQGKNGAKPDCSPEQAKKGGCATDNSPTHKGTATASAAKPS